MVEKGASMSNTQSEPTSSASAVREYLEEVLKNDWDFGRYAHRRALKVQEWEDSVLASLGVPLIDHYLLGSMTTYGLSSLVSGSLKVKDAVVRRLSVDGRLKTLDTCVAGLEFLIPEALEAFAARSLAPSGVRLLAETTHAQQRAAYAIAGSWHITQLRKAASRVAPLSDEMAHMLVYAFEGSKASTDGEPLRGETQP